MGRTKIAEQKYIDEIDKMLRDGLKIEEITPAKLQAMVGGAFSNVSDNLDKYIANNKKNEEEKKKPKAAWFKELSENVSSHMSDKLDDIWTIISKESDLNISAAKEVFEEQKIKVGIKSDQYFEQIKKLEAEVDLHKDSFDVTNASNEILKQKVIVFVEKLKASDIKIIELKKEIEDSKNTIFILNKAKSTIEGQLIEKEKIILNCQ